MRVVFVGSQNVGHRCLEELLSQGHDIVLVCTIRPDPHETVWYKSVQELGELHGLTCEIQPNLKVPYWVERIRTISPDLICVMGWRQLIAPEVLTIPRLGSVAIHFSLLPEGRGFAPVNWALIRGLSRTGATLFHLDEGMDAGDIIAQVEVSIDLGDTAKDLNDRLTEASIAMFRDMLPRLVAGTAPRVPQEHSQASYYAKRIPEDGRVDWAKSALELYNNIRGLTHPYPGAFCYYGERRLYIWKASFLPDAPPWYGAIGQVIKFERGGSAWVMTGEGILQIDQVQVEEKADTAAGDVLNSLKIRLK